MTEEGAGMTEGARGDEEGASQFISPPFQGGD